MLSLSNVGIFRFCFFKAESSFESFKGTESYDKETPGKREATGFVGLVPAQPAVQHRQDTMPLRTSLSPVCEGTVFPSILYSIVRTNRC